MQGNVAFSSQGDRIAWTQVEQFISKPQHRLMFCLINHLFIKSSDSNGLSCGIVKTDCVVDIHTQSSRKLSESDMSNPVGLAKIQLEMPRF